MVKLTVQLLEQLSAAGIVDTSLCSTCLLRALTEARKESQQAYLDEMRSTKGRNMWSSLDPKKRSKNLSSSSTLPSHDGEPHQTKTMTPHDTLLSLHGSLATLDSTDEELQQLMESKLGMKDCPECQGHGSNGRKAHFGYAEEAQMHALSALPSANGSSASAAVTPFSPQLKEVQQTLMAERNTVGIVRRKKEQKAEQRTNSMAHTPTSTLLIQKQPSASGPIVQLPEKVPDRSKDWLLSQFEEMKFTRTPGEKKDQPKLTVLDSDLQRCTSLHTLAVSGNEIAVLENLPGQIKVVQAYGNRIEDIRLRKVQVTRIHAPVPTPEEVALAARKQVVKGVVIPVPPAPIPPPKIVLTSSYPNLLHLGLGFNQLRSITGLLPTASTLLSLDVSWNRLESLEETLEVLATFKKLKSLQLNGNPLVLQKFYRAAVLDIFAEMGSENTPQALETLDGFAVNTHLLQFNSNGATGVNGLTSLNATGGPAPGDDQSARNGSSRGGAQEQKESSSGSPAPSSRTGTDSSTIQPVKPGSASQKPAPGGRRKKPTAAELEAQAQAQRLELQRQAEAKAKLEEERRQAATVHPTLEQTKERSTLTVSICGLVKGLSDPKVQFDKLYTPQLSEEELAAQQKKNKANRKSGGGNNAAATSSGSGERKDGSNSPSGSSKKKSNKNLPPPEESDPADVGWFVSAVRNEVVVPNQPGVSSLPGAPPDNQLTVTKVKQRTRFYFEFRLVHPDGDDSVVKDDHATGWHDGLSHDPAANPTGSINFGTQRGDSKELGRSILYDFESLTTPGVIVQPIDPSLTGSPASFHANVGFVHAISFTPTVEWRDLFAHAGVDVLLYRKDELVKEETKTLTIQAKEFPEPASTSTGVSTSTTPASSSRQSAKGSSSSGQNSPASSNKKKQDTSKGKKGKKGAVELPPPIVTVTSESSSLETHTLLGFHALDLTSFVSVHPRKNFSSLSLHSNDAIFLPSPTVASPTKPGEVKVQEWNPQCERRLHLERTQIQKALPSVLEKATEDGIRVKLKELIQPPPTLPKQEESKEQLQPPSSERGTKSGRLSGRGIGGEKQTALEEPTPFAPLSISSIGFHLNCRPTVGPGSLTFKVQPPQPTPEEQAQAAAIAQAQMGRKGRMKNTVPANNAAASAITPAATGTTPREKKQETAIEA